MSLIFLFLQLGTTELAAVEQLPSLQTNEHIPRGINDTHNNGYQVPGHKNEVPHNSNPRPNNPSTHRPPPSPNSGQGMNNRILHLYQQNFINQWNPGYYRPTNRFRDSPNHGQTPGMIHQIPDHQPNFYNQSNQGYVRPIRVFRHFQNYGPGQGMYIQIPNYQQNSNDQRTDGSNYYQPTRKFPQSPNHGPALGTQEDIHHSTLHPDYILRDYGRSNGRANFQTHPTTGVDEGNPNQNNNPGRPLQSGGGTPNSGPFPSGHQNSPPTL